MTSLQGPGRQNDPSAFADLAQQLQRIRGELNDVGSAILKAAGIRVSPESMTIERTLEVLGSLDVSGNATFSGDMRIEGTLSLPAGIIDNEALANPVLPLAASNTATAFGLTTTDATVVSASIVVPEGFTRCVATGLGSIFFVNPTSAVDYLYSRVYIETSSQSWWGIRPLSMVGPGNGSAALAPNWMTMLAGLTAGQQITFSVRARTAFAGMSDAANLAGIAGQALFFR